MELLPTLFIAKYGIKTESGLPIEFDKHSFMYDIYNDMSPFQAGLKPPQIGWTEQAIIKSFYVAKKLKKDIVYTLPTQGDIGDMAGGKVNRIIAQNPIFKEWVKEHDTVEQKTVGDNIIYYRGTFTTKQAMMVASSLNIHDEVDASNEQVIVQYETRLQANANGWRWYFSHPSLKGKGVDVYWEESDKKEWFITCNTCKTEQILMFPDNIDFEKRWYKCSHCNARLSDLERKKGVWKPTSGRCRYNPLTGEDMYPGETKGPNGEELKRFSGRHISQLMCSWITAEKILEDYAKKDRQYFYNYVLGLPYLSPDDQVPEDYIKRNLVNATHPQEGTVVIGMDTGHGLHYLMGTKAGLFYHGYCNSVAENQALTNPVSNYDPYDEIRMRLRQYDRSILVADQGGDLIGVRKLQVEFPGRVFLTWYRKDRKKKEIITWGDDKEHGKVEADRNRLIQLTIEELKDRRLPIYGSYEDWKPYISHWLTIFRVREIIGEEEDPQYNWQYIWKRNGPDHFMHCTMYYRIGIDRFGEGLAKIVKKDNFMAGVPTGTDEHGVITGRRLGVKADF